MPDESSNVRILRAASTIALTIIGAVIVVALLLDYRHVPTTMASEPDEDLVPTMTIDLRDDHDANSKPGVGADGKWARRF